MIDLLDAPVDGFDMFWHVACRDLLRLHITVALRNPHLKS